MKWRLYPLGKLEGANKEEGAGDGLCARRVQRNSESPSNVSQ